MSVTAPTTAEAPSPAPAIVEAPAPVVATDSTFNATELAAIEAAANGTLKPAEKKPDDYTAAGTEAAAVVDPAKPADAATPPPAAAAPDPATEDADPIPDKLGKFRIQARDFKHAEFLRLQKSLPVEEAYAKVYGIAAPVAAPAAEPGKAVAPAAPEADAEITAIDAEITKLTADSDKAAEDMNTKEAMRLNREVDKLNRKRDGIEAARAAQAKAAEQAQATEAETTFQQAFQESAKNVYAKRPSLADKASADRKEFDAFVQIKAGDPKYRAVFDSPAWPEIMEPIFAEAKGWNKAAAPAPAPALPAPTPGPSAAPRVTAATAIVPGDTPGGAPAPTPTQQLASLDNMSVDELRALLPTGRR